MNKVENAIKEAKDNLYHIPVSILQALPDHVPYLTNCCKTTRTALHRGQRKLFNALLHFLTKYSKKDDYCIYVGSAPGENISAIAELFPHVVFHLYDPKRTKVKSFLKNVIVITNNKGEGVKFTEQTVKSYENPDKILFFSDIRNVNSKGNVTEEIVDSDLILQLSWIQQLKPRVFCLKFRLPYVNTDKTKTSFREYVDGLGVLQPYAPETTTEVRLTNEGKNVFDNNGRLKLIKWKLSTHENRMFYLNTILREWAYYDNVDPDVEGGDHCFDCSLETFFCKEFINTYPEAGNKFSKSKGATAVARLRNWISDYNYKLRLLIPEARLQIAPEYRQLQFEPPIKQFHGLLPLRQRDVLSFLEIIDPINLFVEILDKRGKVALPKKDLKVLLTKNKSLIEEAITHKSMNEFKNYERLEFRGDRILSDSIADYFYEKTSTNDISILNGLLSAFTSGEAAAELFAEKLGLKHIIVINEEECCLDSAAEDVFEASLAAINIIFNKAYVRGVGSVICYNIISSILNEVDFCNFMLKIFPPKTELKELFNENQNKGFLFDKQYIVTVGDGGYKDIHDYSQDRVKVEIKFPPELAGLTPPAYEEYGPKARVERNAAVLFLEFFRNRGILPRPKNRDLGLKFHNC